MSVTVKRKEQQRKTPLLIFILIAALPLFASFLGGVSTGKVSEANCQDSAARIKTAEDKYLALEKEMKVLDMLANKLDSLAQIMQTEVGELDSKFLIAKGVADDGTALSIWKSEKVNLFTKWYGLIEKLKNDTKIETATASHPMIEKRVQMFLKVHMILQQKTEAAVNNMTSLAGAGNLAALTQLQQDLANQQQQLVAQQQLFQKDREIAELNRRLEECKRGDNSAAKTKITDAVKEIREDIFPEIPTSLFNKKQTAKAKDLLDAKMTAITEAVRDIQ